MTCCDTLEGWDPETDACPTPGARIQLVSCSNYQSKGNNLNSRAYQIKRFISIYLTVDDSHLKQLKGILPKSNRRKVKKVIPTQKD